MSKGAESDKSFTETVGRVVRDGLLIGGVALLGVGIIDVLVDPGDAFLSLL